MQRERTRHIIKVLEPGILGDDCRHPVMGFGQVFPRIQYPSHDVEGKCLLNGLSEWLGLVNWSVQPGLFRFCLVFNRTIAICAAYGDENGNCQVMEVKIGSAGIEEKWRRAVLIDGCRD